MNKKIICLFFLSFLVQLILGGCGMHSPVMEVRRLSRQGKTEKIARFLKHRDRFAREEAIKAIVESGECSPRVYDSSTDAEPRVRAALAKSLGSCNNPTALETLLALFDDESPLVRKDAVTSTITNDNCRSECYHGMRTLLDDEDPYVKLAAAKALYNRFPQEAHAAIIDCLSAHVTSTKKEAIEALPLFKNRSDIYYLGEFLEAKSSTLKLAARKSIEKILNRPLRGDEFAKIVANELIDGTPAHLSVAKEPVYSKKMPLPEEKYSPNLKEFRLENRKVAASPDDIAVIIGNRDYPSVDIPSVDYAIRDAILMKSVAMQAFGIKKENIIYIENAKTSDFNKVFGTESQPQGLLYNWSKPSSKVFVYYSGHGAPDPNNSKAYFVPVDSDINYLGLSGYSLDLLYKNLSKIKAEQVVVAIDSCFSGVSHRGALTKFASPVFVKIKSPQSLSTGKIVTFSSSKSDQISTWDTESKHGLFTYHLAKGFGYGDNNHDGHLTVNELYSYLSNKVSYSAKRRMNRDQEPQVFGNKEMRLVSY